MGNLLKTPLDSRLLAEALGLHVKGNERLIYRVLPLSSVTDGGLCFSKVPLTSLPVGCVSIAPLGSYLDEATVLVSDNPRLTFARALRWIDEFVGFHQSTEAPVIHPTATVGIGCAIGCGVCIGANTVIGNNVTIAEGVSIGERCVIKSGAVIGEPGFGFERDESGLPIRLVHLGTVVIGNDVEIGSVTTVCRGTLGNTVLEDFVKVDDHVHVAHNITLRRGAMIVACAELSGGVDVGEGAWIGPNASVIQKRKIGSGAIVGIGANVLKDVPEKDVVAGNPAKPLAKK